MNKWQVSYKTKDAHKIMWSKLTHDSCGNLTGALFTKSNVAKAVNYLKSYHYPGDSEPALDRGINDFIDRFKLDCLNTYEYKPFVHYHQSMIKFADFKERIAIG